MIGNLIKPVLKLNKIKYGKKLSLKGIPFIYRAKKSKIIIGDGVVIKSSFLSNLVGLYTRTIICTRTVGAEIIIGDNVGISGATIYARKGIYIGENTCIGGNTKILDNDFHPLDYQTRNELCKKKPSEEDDSLIPSAEIHIGKNCMIGCNSIILKGSHIGDGCVVGAGSVVRGKFEDGCVIQGNPAVVVRKL